MNAPRLSVRSCRAVAALWWCLASLAGSLPAAHAAKPGNDAGLRLLQAQLPTGASLRRLDCDHLARTVRAATLAHRQDAVAILSAALTLDEWDARRKVENRLSCPCVSQLFQAAVNAAPDRAAALLETAEARYPDCADGLTEALHRLDDKNVVMGALATSSQVAAVSRAADPAPAAPTGKRSSTGTGGSNLSSPAGNSASAGTTNSSDSAPDGGTASFPGTPSFGGGSAGGAPLPTPVPLPATPSVNH